MAKLIFILFIGIVSCYGGYKKDDNMLTGKWRYESSPLNIVTASDTTRLPFLEFGKDGKTVSGFLGCNRFGARFSIKGEAIKFTEIMQTKMACDNMEDENKFSAFLAGVGEYKIENEKMLLFTEADKKKFIVFRKIK
jgi:heat shock protein HslJ